MLRHQTGFCFSLTRPLHSLAENDPFGNHARNRLSTAFLVSVVFQKREPLHAPLQTMPINILINSEASNHR